MRTSTAFARTACTALLALFLALRVLVSAGYMPALEHGRLTLMLCPDGQWTAPAATMPGMDHGHAPKGDHQQCFYAAAAAMSFAGAEPVPLPAILAIAFACLAASALPALSRSCPFERPFATGPPLPA